MRKAPKVRTKRWRKVSLPIALIWTALAAAAAWQDFHPWRPVEIGLILTSLYLALVGIVQQFLYGQDG